MKKWDWLLISGCLVIGAALFFFLRVGKEEGKTAVVRVSGQITASYALEEDRTVVIEGKDGGTNTLVIERGTARLSEATCPDKLCVYQGTVHLKGQTIICLPNEVIIEILGTEKEEADYDVIAG